MDMTIAMMKINIKLPTPTQYDGKSPLTPQNSMNGQRDAVANDLQSFNARYPQPIHYGEDHYDDYMDRWEGMEKKKEGGYLTIQPDFELCATPCHKARIGTTLHHAETGGHCAQQFSLLRASTQPTWDTTSTKQFTKQCYKWLEDIGRYEAENGANTITEHVKIATIVNNLQGPMGQQLMLRINQHTTFDEVRTTTKEQLGTSMRQRTSNMMSGRTTMSRQKSTMRSTVTRTGGTWLQCSIKEKER
eukprot:2735894-Amphidinium_carterae.1